MIFHQSVFDPWPIEDNFVQTIITSPPYFWLRKYDIPDITIGGDQECSHDFISYGILSSGGMCSRHSPACRNGIATNFQYNGGRICVKCGAWQGQYGLEPYPYGHEHSYVSHTMLWLKEAWRVLKKDGCLFLNVADSYYHKKVQNLRNQVKEKTKLLIPERIMIAMMDSGWIIRNHIVWEKPNALPESVQDRFAKRWESIIFAVKNPSYYFNLDAVSCDTDFDIDIENGTSSPSVESEYTNDSLFDISNYVCNNAPEDENFSLSVRKYRVEGGHTNRAGLEREPCDGTIDAYRRYQFPIAMYIKKHINGKESKLDRVFGRSKWRHWVRTDLSGAALPGPKDWVILKKLLKMDDRMDYLYQEAIQSVVPRFIPGRNPGDVWRIPTQPFNGYHYATWPEKLVKRMVLCSTNPGDIVLDPFCGSGTTLKVALKLGRKAYGIDLGYEDIQKDRLSCLQLPLVS